MPETSTLLQLALTILVASLILAAGSLALTHLARAIATPMQLQRRPWSCHVCMSLAWTTPPLTLAAIRLTWWGMGEVSWLPVVCGLAAWPPAAGIAIVVLTGLEHLERMSHRIGGLTPPNVSAERQAATLASIPKELAAELGLHDENI